MVVVGVKLDFETICKKRQDGDKCPECGKKNKKEFGYCYACGEELSDSVCVFDDSSAGCARFFRCWKMPMFACSAATHLDFSVESVT